MIFQRKIIASKALLSNNFSLLSISELNGNLEGKELFFLDENFNPVRVKSIRKIPYSGRVYDVDVPNDVVLVRREITEGTWSGNTNSGTREVEIPFWLENDKQAWVKVPKIENNTNTTLYMYYGNPSASSASNGTNTFLAFAFFDLTGYTETDPSNYLTVNSPTKVTYTGMSTAQTNYLLKDGGSAIVTGDFSFDFNFMQTSAVNGGRYTIVALSDTSTHSYPVTGGFGSNGIWIQYLNGVLMGQRTDGAAPTFSTSYAITANTRYYGTMQRVGSTGTAKLYSDSARTNLLDTRTLTVTTAALRYSWLLYSNYEHADSASGDIQNTIVRKYASPEPSTLSVGAEQNKPRSGSAGSVQITPPASFLQWQNFSADSLLGWQYKKEINISNTAGNLTNYQVNVKLINGTNFNYSKAQTNGSDIRFTAPLSYSGGGKWLYKKEIIINNRANPSAWTNNWTLINLIGVGGNDYNFDFSHSFKNGSDIRFYDADTKSEMNYSINSWNSTTLLANVSVQIASIPGNSGKRIWIFYGNPNAAGLGSSYSGSLTGLNYSLGSEFSINSSYVEVPYWIESWNSSANSSLWAKVPFLQNGTNTTLYMYYGNPSAAAASNGANTFEFFDDFSGDLSKWTITGNAVIQNGVAKVTGAAAWDVNGITSVSTFSRPVVIELNAFRDITMTFHMMGYGVQPLNYQSGLYIGADVTSIDRYLDGAATYGLASNTGTASHKYTFVLKSSSGYTLKYDETTIADSSTYTSNNLKIALQEYRSTVVYFDNVRVRKFSSPEPNASVSTTDTSGDFSAGVSDINFKLLRNSQFADWKYRKPITLNGSTSNLADYQVALNLTTAIYNNTGLVGSWHFSEGSGNRTADSSGYGNDGTMYGNMNTTLDGNLSSGWVSAGKFGNALRFDGVNDYVNVSNSTILNPTNALTLIAWIKLGTIANATILSKNQSAYELGTNSSGNIIFTVNTTTLAGSTALSSGTWYHIAAVYNTTNISVFVNAVSDGIAGYSSGIPANQLFLLIGSNSSLGRYSNGTIDEVRIYNRSLSATEIAEQYQAGKARLDYQDLRFTWLNGTGNSYDNATKVMTRMEISRDELMQEIEKTENPRPEDLKTEDPRPEDLKTQDLRTSSLVSPVMMIKGEKNDSFSGFLYFKLENETLEDMDPSLTFKFMPQRFVVGRIQDDLTYFIHKDISQNGILLTGFVDLLPAFGVNNGDVSHSLNISSTDPNSMNGPFILSSSSFLNSSLKGSQSTGCQSISSQNFQSSSEIVPVFIYPLNISFFSNSSLATELQLTHEKCFNSALNLSSKDNVMLAIYISPFLTSSSNILSCLTFTANRSLRYADQLTSGCLSSLFFNSSGIDTVNVAILHSQNSVNTQNYGNIYSDSHLNKLPACNEIQEGYCRENGKFYKQKYDNGTEILARMEITRDELMQEIEKTENPRPEDRRQKTEDLKTQDLRTSSLISLVMMDKFVKDDGISFQSEKQDETPGFNSLEFTQVSPEIFEVADLIQGERTDLINLLLNLSEQGRVFSLEPSEGSFKLVRIIDIHNSSHHLLNSSRVIGFLFPDLSSSTTLSVDSMTSLTKDSLTSLLSSSGIPPISRTLFLISSSSTSPSVSENARLAMEDQLTQSTFDIRSFSSSGTDSVIVPILNTSDIHVYYAYPKNINNCSEISTGYCRENGKFYKQGWKYFSELTPIDEVLTLKQETKTPEWQKPERYLIDDYSGDLYEIGLETGDKLLVTPGQMVYVNYKNSESFWRSLTTLPSSSSGGCCFNNLEIARFCDSKSFGRILNSQIPRCLEETDGLSRKSASLVISNLCSLTANFKTSPFEMVLGDIDFPDN